MPRRKAFEGAMLWSDVRMSCSIKSSQLQSSILYVPKETCRSYVGVLMTMTLVLGTDRRLSFMKVNRLSTKYREMWQRVRSDLTVDA